LNVFFKTFWGTAVTVFPRSATFERVVHLYKLNIKARSVMDVSAMRA
jgi:hypothetical protein